MHGKILLKERKDKVEENASLLTSEFKSFLLYPLKAHIIVIKLKHLSLILSTRCF